MAFGGHCECKMNGEVESGGVLRFELVCRVICPEKGNGDERKGRGPLE